LSKSSKKIRKQCTIVIDKFSHGLCFEDPVFEPEVVDRYTEKIAYYFAPKRINMQYILCESNNSQSTSLGNCIYHDKFNHFNWAKVVFFSECPYLVEDKAVDETANITNRFCNKFMNIKKLVQNIKYNKCNNRINNTDKIELDELNDSLSILFKNFPNLVHCPSFSPHL
jgi:hypothetical protein